MAKFSYFIGTVIMASSLCGCASFQDEVSVGESNGLYEKYMSFYAKTVSRSSVDGDSVLDPVETLIPLDSPVNMIDISALPLMNLEQLDSIELLIKTQYDIPVLSLAEQQEREDYMLMMVQDALGDFGGVSVLLDFMQKYTESGDGPDNLVALAPAGLNGISENIYLRSALCADCCMIPLTKYSDDLHVECLYTLLPTISGTIITDTVMKQILAGVAIPELDALYTAEDLYAIIKMAKDYYECAHPDRIR